MHSMTERNEMKDGEGDEDGAVKVVNGKYGAG
jgi:hypothetical protein